MNRRYRELIAASGRRAAWQRIVAHARERGVHAAAAMSGACLRTVRKLIKRADAGNLVPRKPVPPRLTPEDEARIVDAKLAHPRAGVMRLKREHGLPYGNRQILRVLRETGLRTRWLDHDPARRLRVSERRLLAARLELKVAEVARAHGFERVVFEVERMRRRLRIAEGTTRYWRKRIADLAAHPDAPDGPDAGSPPTPDDARYLEYAEEGELRADGSARSREVLGDFGAVVDE